MVKIKGEEDYPIYFGAGPELMRIKEIRFKNEELVNHIDQVIQKIEAELENQSRNLSLPPRGGRAGIAGPLAPNRQEIISCWVLQPFYPQVL